MGACAKLPNIFGNKTTFAITHPGESAFLQLDNGLDAFSSMTIFEARARLGLVEGNLYSQSQRVNGDLFTIGTPRPAEDRYYNSSS